MLRSAGLRLCFLAVLACAAAAPAAAQREAPPPDPADTPVTLLLREVDLATALERLAQASRMAVLFDPTLGDGVRVSCRSDGEPALALLRCIVREAGLDFYRLSSGTFVIVAGPRAAPAYGALAGRVLDARTLVSLPGASVQLVDAPRGTATSDDGLFTFARLPAGRYLVRTSYVGYRPRVDTLVVAPGAGARYQILLRPTTLAATPVVVDGLRAQAPRAQLGAREARADPLRGAPDVADATGRLDGVALRAPLADVHVQGAAAGEHGYRLDGMSIFNPVSMGYLRAAFSPLAIGTIRVHRAGFGAPHGSHTAGAVELVHDVPGPRSPRVELRADPYSVDARANLHRDGGRPRVAAMLSARRGLYDAYALPAIDALMREWNVIDPVLTALALDTPEARLTFAPHRHTSRLGYSDLHGSARIGLAPFHRLYVSGYRGRNRVETSFLSAQAAATAIERVLLADDRYRWSNDAVQGRYSGLIGSRAVVEGQASVSRHRLRHRYRLLDSAVLAAPGLPPAVLEGVLRDALAADPAAPADASRTREIAVGATLDVAVGDGHALGAGLTLFQNRYRLRLDTPDLPLLPPLELEGRLWRPEGWVRLTRRLGASADLEAGVRAAWVAQRRTLYAEPRLALRLDGAIDGVGGFAVRLAGGLYRQYVNQFDLSTLGPSAIVPALRFWLPSDATLRPPRAVHVALEGSLAPSERLQLRAEGFARRFARVPMLDYARLLALADRAPHELFQAHVVGTSDGFARGGMVRAEWTGERARLEAGYALTRSRRTYPGRYDGARVADAWTTPHRLDARASRRLGAAWTLRASASRAWGATWALRQAYYDFGPPAGLDAVGDVPFTAPGADALPPRTTLDLGVAYAPRLGPARLRASLELVNALDARPAYDRGLRFDADGTARVVDRRLPGRHVLLSLQVGV